MGCAASSPADPPDPRPPRIKGVPVACQRCLDAPYEAHLTMAASNGHERCLRR